MKLNDKEKYPIESEVYNHHSQVLVVVHNLLLASDIITNMYFNVYPFIHFSLMPTKDKVSCLAGNLTLRQNMMDGWLSGWSSSY